MSCAKKLKIEMSCAKTLKDLVFGHFDFDRCDLCRTDYSCYHENTTVYVVSTSHNGQTQNDRKLDF